jgi:hypothetical protein
VQASGRAERLIIQFEIIGQLWHPARLNEMNVVRVLVVALICANGGWLRRLLAVLGLMWCASVVEPARHGENCHERQKPDEPLEQGRHNQRLLC